MAAVEDLLDIMRKQGSIDNPAGLELAEMTGPASAAIGDLTLDPEDLYILYTEEQVKQMQDEGTYRDACDALWRNYCISNTFD